MIETTIYTCESCGQDYFSEESIFKCDTCGKEICLSCCIRLPLGKYLCKKCQTK